jgi:hypothetical protein
VIRSMKNVFLILAISAALPAVAADPVDEVRRAEVAFAKAFADRDQAKFFSFVLDDASFLGGLRTIRQPCSLRSGNFYAESGRWQPAGSVSSIAQTGVASQRSVAD